MLGHQGIPIHNYEFTIFLIASRYEGDSKTKTSFACLQSTVEFKFEPRFRLLNKILICIGIKHAQCVCMKTLYCAKFTELFNLFFDDNK